MNDTPTHHPAPTIDFAIMPTVQKYGRSCYYSYSSDGSASFATKSNDGGGASTGN